jgi:hypothetical protein
MKSLNYYEVTIFILVLLKISNCVENYKNEEESFFRGKRAISPGTIIEIASKAFSTFKTVKDVFREACVAYKCLRMGKDKCLIKIKDSLFKPEQNNFGKVFDKLDNLSNQFSTELKCEFIGQEYNEIWKKINRILKRIKTFLNVPNDKIAKKSLQDLCRDNSQGIDMIHSLIEDFLEEKKLAKIALNCHNYKSDKLEGFHYDTLTMILQFMIISSNCEQLFNYNKFDYEKFWYETESYLTYYKEYSFPLKFTQDLGYNGLNEVVKRKYKENGAKKAVEQLNKEYSYFDWTFFEWSTILFADNMAIRPFMSRPKITSQSFSLPSKEMKSDDKFKNSKNFHIR